MRYMKLEPPSNAVDETYGFVCLIWATFGGRKDVNEVGRSVKESD